MLVAVSRPQAGIGLAQSEAVVRRLCFRIPAIQREEPTIASARLQRSGSSPQPKAAIGNSNCDGSIADQENLVASSHRPGGDVGHCCPMQSSGHHAPGRSPLEPLPIAFPSPERRAGLARNWVGYDHWQRSWARTCIRCLRRRLDRQTSLTSSPPRSNHVGWRARTS